VVAGRQAAVAQAANEQQQQQYSLGHLGGRHPNAAALVVADGGAVDLEGPGVDHDAVAHALRRVPACNKQQYTVHVPVMTGSSKITILIILINSCLRVRTVPYTTILKATELAPPAPALKMVPPLMTSRAVTESGDTQMLSW
jgi:hypothetical protein